MRPRIFIGSSKEGEKIARAIQQELPEAHCSVWTQGVFGLSKSAIENLMNHLEASQFGIFVFSSDDIVKIRGDVFPAPRDNVVYELGLFTGALGTHRCFFAIPEGKDIRLPSDLLGITAGRYQTDRSDLRGAVGSFCTDVRNQISELTIRFVNPAEDARLSEGTQTFTLECTVPPGDDVFILTRKGPRWWPRSNPFVPIAANKYEVQLFLDQGFQSINAVKATPLGILLIHFYLDTVKKLSDSGLSKDALLKRELWYPGISARELPRGLTLLDSLTFEVVSAAA
jgi:hypothetical protein